MKKTVIVLATLTAMLSTVSCLKENGSETVKYTPMTFCAESKGMNTESSKAEMAYRYDLLWQENDEILVKNASERAVFKLVSEPGTTKGTFHCENSPFKAGDEVEAYYPQSIDNGTGLYWPDTLVNNQTVPMYCKKTLSANENETFNFTSLGAVIQLVFNTTQDDITLRFIDIRDTSKTMSGHFYVDTVGKAVITDTDKIGVTLDLGESGVALGRGANFFNIPVPAGDYRDLILIFTTTDNRQCVFKNGKLNVGHNTVGRLSLTGRYFKPITLPGVFSIGENKKIRFSKGNLYARYHSRRNAWIWDFYHEQYSSNSLNAKCKNEQRYPSENDDETDLFCWGYGEWSTDPVDVTYITNDQFRDWAEALPKSKGSWRTLTTDEWCYMLAYDKKDSIFIKESPRYDLSKKFCTVCGIENCVVIAPDDWDKDANPLQNEYSTTSSPMTWKQAEDAGLVCLPSAGYRTYKDKRICAIGTEVYCWSITPDPKQQSDFYNSFCLSRTYLYGGSFMPQSSSDRRMGRSVRLVTDVE